MQIVVYMHACMHHGLHLQMLCQKMCNDIPVKGCCLTTSVDPTLSGSSSEHCSDRSVFCKDNSISQSPYDYCKVSNQFAIAIADVHCKHIKIFGIRKNDMHKKEMQVGLCSHYI